jgi:hypothetical protein
LPLGWLIAIPLSAMACASLAGLTGGAVEGDAGADETGVKHGDARADGTLGHGGDGGADAASEAGNDAGSDGPCDAMLSSDPQNCGACGRSCGVENCQDASCSPRVLVTGLKLTGGIAVDSKNVYFLTTTTVDSVPLDGGTVSELATGLTDVNYLAIDSTYAYVSIEPPTGTGPVLRIRLTGGTPYTLAPNREAPNGVAATAGKLFWAEQGDGGMNGAVLSIPSAGGTPSVVVSGEIGPEQLAVDSDNVYFSNWDWGGNSVVQAPLSGSAPITLAVLPRPLGIAIDTSNVYFSNIGDAGTVNQVHKGGGTVLLLAHTPSAGTLASDGTSVYWTDSVLGTLQKIPVGGGSIVTLLSGLMHPYGIALDETSVYIVEVEANTIVRLNK